jgi:hypothetical protein
VFYKTIAGDAQYTGRLQVNGIDKTTQTVKGFVS